jgi:hypothetical protein
MTNILVMYSNMYFVRGLHDISARSEHTGGRNIGRMKCNDSDIVIIDERPYVSPVVFRAPVYDISVLKSNLQKCIRRGLAEPAFATTYQMMAQDANELLRRLPIIMCEDAQLCPPAFNEIVWLMAAVSKGYCINANDMQRVYDFVSTMLGAAGRYNRHYDAVDCAEPRDSVTDLAFIIRIGYGGMPGDMEFMELLRRRHGAGSLPTCEYLAAPVMTYNFNVRRDIVPWAVDFHCRPHMLKEMPAFTKDYIWWHWSSLNVRTVVGDGADFVVEREAMERATRPLVDHMPLELFAKRVICQVGATSKPPAAVVQTRLDGFFARKK